MSPGEVLEFPHPHVRPNAKARTKPKRKGSKGKPSKRHVTAAQRRRSDRERGKRHRDRKAQERQRTQANVTPPPPAAAANQAAVEPQPSRDTAAPVPPLQESIAHAIEYAGLSALVIAALIGNYALVRATLEAIIPGKLEGWLGTCGAAATLMLVAVETVVGHRFHKRWTTGKRDAYGWMLLALLLLSAVVEAGIAAKRVDIEEQELIEKALHQVPPTAPTVQAVDVAAIGAHPKTMKGAVEAAGKVNLDAQREREDREDARAEKARRQAKEDAEKHRTKDTLVQIGLALIASLGTAACAPVFGEFLGSLLAIPAGFATLFRRVRP